METTNHTNPETTQTITTTTVTHTEHAKQTDHTNGTSIEFTETTIMAALSYISILVFIPFLAKRGDSFITFHVRQGLIVFALGLVAWLLDSLISSIGSILQLCVVILSVIGIVNALRKEEKALPIIGKYAQHIKL